MDTDSTLIGSPITLAELKMFGKFVRWQDIKTRISDLLAAKRLPDGYPLVPSRLPASGAIDLCIDGRWQQVKYLRMEGTQSWGDRRIVYQDEGKEDSIRYDWYSVAPIGHFTEWKGLQPEPFTGAELLAQYDLVHHDDVMHSQTLKSVDWPYLTFEVTSYDRNARWVEREDMRTRSYTVHAADPRVKLQGVVSREPWFNTTIAVSHRWLRPDHPDPDGEQFRELLALSESLGLHDNQTFLIDYCSLPQQPRSEEEAIWLRENLPGFQAQYKYVTIVLNTGSADYSTRAWCMLELILAALSRASRPVLLNHDKLDAPLSAATKLAQKYVQESIWNQQGMLKAFPGGMTGAGFAKWARDPINVALYNASIDGRRKILEKFENEFEVADPNDRPIILKLIKQLAFEESED